jgi:catechol 2,3-dioxygenase-like lactoylglutathione lyase family enzyme
MDIDRSVAFYNALGFEEVVRLPTSDEEAINVFMNQLATVPMHGYLLRSITAPIGPRWTLDRLGVRQSNRSAWPTERGPAMHPLLTGESLDELLVPSHAFTPLAQVLAAALSLARRRHANDVRRPAPRSHREDCAMGSVVCRTRIASERLSGRWMLGAMPVSLIRVRGASA